MTRNHRLLAAPALAVLGGLVMPSAARADVTKAQCVTANSTAQDLRRDRKLGEAREQLQICSDPKCPDIVRADCTKRLDELEGAQPTIVFDAKDGNGADLTVVKVSVDNKPLVDKLDGSALRIDPGEHTFTFEVAGQPPVTEHLVLKEGDKERHEKVVIGTPTAAAAGAAGDTGAAPMSNSGGWSTQKWIGVGVAGAGVVGLAVGGVFGVLTMSAINQQKTDCPSASNCPSYGAASSDHSTWTTDGTISTVGFIAGGALLAGGAILFFTAPKSTQEAPAAAKRETPRWVALPSIAPSGGGMLVQGAF